MEIQEVKNNLNTVCCLFKLGTLKGFRTEVNEPCNGFSTAFFKTSKSEEEELKFHFKT